jgi:2-dehydropantoate 2-reductase
VSVLARGATLQARRARDCGIEHEGRRQFAPVHAAEDPAQLGVQDLVVLAVGACARRGGASAGAT